MEECFWKNGISFLCTRCSACCRYEPGFVFLVESDREAILKTLNIDYETFVRNYCRWVPFSDGYEYLSLTEKQNYDCIFWDNGCSIYKARPLQCSSYPFWPNALQSLDVWRAVTAGCSARIRVENGSTEKAPSIPFFSAAKILEIRNKQINARKIRRRGAI